MPASTNNLENIIKDKIKQHGSISFAEYMQLALYHPEYGYYMSAKEKFGKNGDFITAPEIGSLFAKCLANQIAEIIENNWLGTVSSAQEILALNILEFGAGRGKLAIDLVLELHNLGHHIANYIIIDISPNLAALQQQNISDSNIKTTTNTNFIWLDKVPDNFDGIIIANELFDAMPVNCFKITKDNIVELGVGYNKELTWQERELPKNSELLHAVKNLDLKKDEESYISEINLNLTNFFDTLSNKVNKAIMLFIDYGFKRQEYYHRDRNTGTLMCHYKHKASTDPLHSPGLQDITAHVDFSYLKDIAEKYNCNFEGYTTLANFLIGCGLIDITENLTDPNLQFVNRIAKEINLLTSPAEMGELFKVVALSKGVQNNVVDLCGFSFKNLML